MDRLTYKSGIGDYGSTKIYDNEFSEKCALRNALGRYEDLGYSVAELKKILQQKTNAR